MESYYSKVLEFNETIGIKLVGDDFFSDEETFKVVNTKKDLIYEEVCELKNALIKKNVVEMIDALIDILYVLYGIYICYEIKPPFMDFNEYIKSDIVVNYFKSNNINIESFNKNLSMKDYIYMIECYDFNFERDIIHDNVRHFCMMGTNRLYINGILDNILKTVFNIFIKLKIHPDIFFNAVHISNMTKFCNNELDLKNSIIHYINKNIRCYFRHNTKKNLYILHKESNDKCLKPLTYVPPNIDELLNNLLI